MAKHDFTLTFPLPDPDVDPADFLDALFEAGCDDATPGVGRRGVIAVTFSREAATREQAVASALRAVMTAIPGTEPIGA